MYNRWLSVKWNTGRKETVKKRVVVNLDVQFLRCHSNTKKCNILDNCETLGEQHECRKKEVYVAPKEIPKDWNVLIAMVVRRKG